MAKKKSQSQITESARKKCVELAKKINKILSGNKCEYCGIDHGQMNSHHIFNEGAHKSMSSDIDNLICVCVLHHGNGRFPARAGTFGFHRTPAEAVIWLEENRGEQYKALKERSRQLKQIGEYEWNLKYISLKQQYKELCSIKSSS